MLRLRQLVILHQMRDMVPELEPLLHLEVRQLAMRQEEEQRLLLRVCVLEQVGRMVRTPALIAHPLDGDGRTFKRLTAHAGEVFSLALARLDDHDGMACGTWASLAEATLTRTAQRCSQRLELGALKGCNGSTELLVLSEDRLERLAPRERVRELRLLSALDLAHGVRVRWGWGQSMAGLGSGSGSGFRLGTGLDLQ